jgi:CRP/FNR family transcriptional regulator
MIDFKSVPLFEYLDDTTLQKLQKMSRTAAYAKGDILFYEGETPEALVVLTKGRLKLYKTTSTEREIVLNHFSPVSLVAEVALMQGIAYPATAEFETDGEVILIDAAAFDDLFFSTPETARTLVSSLSKKVKMLESVIERGMVMDAQERVSTLVKNSPELLNTMRHYEIAQMLNLTPETFSRTLKKLQKEGVLVKENERWISTSEA